MRTHKKAPPLLDDTFLPRQWEAMSRRAGTHMRAFTAANQHFPKQISTSLYDRFRHQAIPRTQEELFARRHQVSWFSHVLSVFERLASTTSAHRAGVMAALENLTALDMPLTLGDRSLWESRLAAIQAMAPSALLPPRPARTPSVRAVTRPSGRTYRVEEFRSLVLGKTNKGVVASVGRPTVRRNTGHDLWGYSGVVTRGRTELIHFQNGKAHAIYQVD